MHTASTLSLKRHLLVAGIIAATLTTSACRHNPNPAVISVTVPQPNTIQAGVTLTQRFGLGLSGNFPVTVQGVNYGSIFLTPESPAAGLGFGFTLNTATFLKETWVNYEEVMALPTGDAFPMWMSGPVVEIDIPPANTDIMDWRFYFGTRSQFYVGVATLIHAIGNNFPSLRMEYSFYDNQNRAIIGLVFFGPKRAADGSVEIPGGIFVGTNITPFLPPEMRYPDGTGSVASSQMALSSSELKSLTQGALSGRPVSFRGQSVTADLNVSGRDARRYRSKESIQRLADRFTAASRL